MSNYQDKQQKQTYQTGTALMMRLTTNHLAITPETKDTLLAQGISESMLPMLAAGCLSINVPPNLLRYTHNVPVVVNALKLITELGYRPNEDFYVSTFKSNVPVLDENGEPTDQKAKAPTVVVMLSSARIEENAKQDDRMRNLIHHVETGIVEDEDEAKVIFDEAFKGKKPYKDAIVAYAELYTYHAKSGHPIGSGKPQVFYGFYAPWYYYNNKESLDNNEANKPKSNYEAPQIARKRAASKAFRAVSRNNFARDDRSVDLRLAALMESAQTKLTIAERMAGELGVDFDTALTDGEKLLEEKRQQRDSTLWADSDLDDFDRLMLYGEEEPSTDDDDMFDGEFAQTGEPEANAENDDTLTKEDAIVDEWIESANVAQAAKDWAIEIGAQPNEYAASNSLAKIVKSNFSGRFTTENAREVLRAYYFRQQDKLKAQLNAISVEDAEPIAA